MQNTEINMENMTEIKDSKIKEMRTMENRFKSVRNEYIKDQYKNSFICDMDTVSNILNNYEHKSDEIVKNKIDYQRMNMNVFLQETIINLLWNCVGELVTIETSSQVDLAHKIEDEIIPFINNYKYLEYESIEEMKKEEGDK